MDARQRRRLREQLRRLGRARGAPARVPTATAPPSSLEEALQGTLVETERGTYLRVERCFPLSHVHGRHPLGRVLDAPRSPLRHLLRPAPTDPPPVETLLFLDTETTGLAGGTGTLPFLVGVGVLAEDRVCVRQYFLPDVSAEEAMLHALTQDITPRKGVVTYNGRVFDLPVLETRFLLQRMSSPLASLADLDLLVAVRRVWKLRLRQCALSNVERHILGHRRDQRDIPGWLVPSLYREYLRTRDPRPLAGVFYHNLHDVLSMIGLVDMVLRVWEDPWAEAAMKPEDFVAWARWLLPLGREEEAEMALRHALRHLPPGEIRLRAYDLLGTLLKRRGEHARAVDVWTQWVEEAPYSSVRPYEELAKYYEWTVRDADRALEWVRRAQEALQHMDAVTRYRWQAALDHREGRLREKVERGTTPESRT